MRGEKEQTENIGLEVAQGKELQEKRNPTNIGMSLRRDLST